MDELQDNFNWTNAETRRCLAECVARRIDLTTLGDLLGTNDIDLLTGLACELAGEMSYQLTLAYIRDQDDEHWKMLADFFFLEDAATARRQAHEMVAAVNANNPRFQKVISDLLGIAERPR